MAGLITSDHINLAEIKLFNNIGVSSESLSDGEGRRDSDESRRDSDD